MLAQTDKSAIWASAGLVSLDKLFLCARLVIPLNKQNIVFYIFLQDYLICLSQTP